MSLNIPFYWRVRSEDEQENPMPDFLHFDWDFDPSIGLIKQNTNPSLLETLNKMYRLNSNIGYLRKDNTLAASYGEDWYNFLRTLTDAKKSQILEIGCGGCVILEKMRNSGHTVIGIDPSPFAVEHGRNLNIEVIDDFFPSQKIQSQFDLIFHMDVLEHVPDPVAFLASHKSHLKTGGKVAVSVPDCTESIELGDLSMIIHQHLNYFSTESLMNTLRKAGFTDIQVTKAGYGGSLYGVGTIGKKEEPLSHSPFNHFDTFLEKTTRNIENLKKFNEFLWSKGVRTIGIYCPLRFLPYMQFWDQRIQVRFFDDTPHWYGKYFDGVNVPIENGVDLLKNKPDVTLIMSLTFDRKISDKLLAKDQLIIHNLRGLLLGF